MADLFADPGASIASPTSPTSATGGGGNNLDDVLGLAAGPAVQLMLPQVFFASLLASNKIMPLVVHLIARHEPLNWRSHLRWHSGNLDKVSANFFRTA